MSPRALFGNQFRKTLEPTHGSRRSRRIEFTTPRKRPQIPLKAPHIIGAEGPTESAQSAKAQRQVLGRTTHAHHRFTKLAAGVESGQTKVFELNDCIDLAKENELLDDMLPDAKDENRAFGHYVRRKHLRGWHFTDEQNRRCDFKKAADSNRGSR